MVGRCGKLARLSTTLVEPRALDRVGFRHFRKEVLQHAFGEIVHRHHHLGPELTNHLGDAGKINRPGAVDRRKHHIHLADGREMLRRQRVVKMPEMGDAEPGGLEDEDRIAVELRAALAPAATNVGGHVAHAQVAFLQVMLRHLAGSAPAAQHVADRRIGRMGEMRRVCVVHRRHVGRHLGADVIVVIGRGGHAARRLDREGRVAHISETHLAGLQRGGKDRRAIGRARRVACDGPEAGLVGLGGNDPEKGRDEPETEGDPHARTSALSFSTWRGKAGREEGARSRVKEARPAFGLRREGPPF